MLVVWFTLFANNQITYSFFLAGMAVYNSSYGHPKRAIRYTNVYCRGHEEELGDCTHHTLELEAGRTYKAEVAGVDCGGILSVFLLN